MVIRSEGKKTFVLNGRECSHFILVKEGAARHLGEKGN